MHWGPQVRTGGPKLEPEAPDHMDSQALDALFHYGAAVARVTVALRRGANGERLMPVGNVSPSIEARAGRTAQDGTHPIGQPR
jgi:hypothetical protein